MKNLPKYLSILFFIGILNIKNHYCTKICSPKVAIIGAGIGGASASHFLTELFGENILIDIFESETVGGRLATIKFNNEEFEAGGSIIHPKNKYMKDFLKLLNLNVRPTSDSHARVGVWNGKEFVFEESDWELITFLKLVYRYGVQPFHLHRYVNSILNDFEKIYDLQNEGIGFDNVTAMLTAMNTEFINLLKISIKDHLSNLNYKTKLIDELVEASLVVNYGQDINVHAFVAIVSVAGAGFNLWSVKGGNKKVPQHLISNNRKVSLIHATVDKIYQHFDKDVPKYEIFYKNDDQITNSSIYDIVIIATPLTSDQKALIKFEGFKNPDLKFSGEYQTTIVTFVSGRLNASYFGADEDLLAILSCNPVETTISSIGSLSTVEGDKDNRTTIWKIFSRKKLNNIILNKMFYQIDEVKEIKWKAYPCYSSAVQLNKFKLDDSLYYINAVEWVASAMEMSAISGRNAAILSFNDYKKRCPLPSLNKEVFTEKTQTHSPEL